jgi:hypothetical protein
MEGGAHQLELATFYDLADNNSEAAATQILDALIPRVFVEAPRKEDDEEYYDLFQRILHDPDAKNEKDYLRKVNIVSEQLLFLQFGMSGTTSMYTVVDDYDAEWKYMTQPYKIRLKKAAHNYNHWKLNFLASNQANWKYLIVCVDHLTITNILDAMLKHHLLFIEFGLETKRVDGLQMDPIAQYAHDFEHANYVAQIPSAIVTQLKSFYDYVDANVQQPHKYGIKIILFLFAHEQVDYLFPSPMQDPKKMWPSDGVIFDGLSEPVYRLFMNDDHMGKAIPTRIRGMMKNEKLQGKKQVVKDYLDECFRVYCETLNQWKTTTNRSPVQTRKRSRSRSRSLTGGKINARKPTFYRYQKRRCTNKKHEKIVVPTSNTKSATSL